MIIPWEAVATIVGYVVPPVTDFIKKKFIKSENDTPERTMGSLATTKPEVLPDYLRALTEWTKSQVEFFNRDLVPGGMPSQWVIDLRAAIRPITVVLCIMMLSLDAVQGYALGEGVRASMCANIGHWFGTRSV